MSETRVQPGGAVSPAEALRAELEPYLSEQAGAKVTIERMAPLAGGASMDTWSIDALVGSEHEAWVLRRDMGSNMTPDALTRAQEAALIEAARRHGVSAPRVRFTAPPGAPRGWFVMERRPGEGVGRKIVSLPALEGARAGLARQLGKELACVHHVPLSAVTEVLTAPSERPTEVALSAVAAMMARLERHNPTWALGLRWLTRRMPKGDEALSLVHGDYRIGNVLVTPSGLSAVLDWEFAHLGDRHEDLAWITLRDWRFERDALEVGGVGTRDDFLAGYREAGGAPVDEARIVWWAVLGNLRWAVICHAQAERHLSGVDRSVEFASLGRKAAEIEWELLYLLRQHGDTP